MMAVIFLRITRAAYTHPRSGGFGHGREGKTRGLTAEDEISDAFGSEAPFSVGVEEELFLVDPVTGRQVNSSTAVLERLGPIEGTVERELHACQVELITDICRSAGEAVLTLDGLRRAVVQTGAGLLGSGTHPSASEGDAEITDKQRYERIRDLLGDAVATPVGGCTSMSACPTQRRRSVPSTACAAICRCCRRWPPTRRSATIATRASHPRAR